MQSDSGELSRPAGPPPPLPLQCPRCNSTDTKFCYYNNHNLSQPRHLCRSCGRYWTHGGALRNIPARLPTPKRSRSSSSSSSSPVTPPPRPPPSGGSFPGLLANSQGSDFPALEFDFGSDLEVARSFGTWQFVIGEEVEPVEGAGFTWPDLTVSAPGDGFDPIKSKEMGQI